MTWMDLGLEGDDLDGTGSVLNTSKLLNWRERVVATLIKLNTPAFFTLLCTVVYKTSL